MLNLSRLHLLHQLAMLGTITKVAAAVGLTRPAISQQLSILEKETGAVLFEHSGRGVRLTVAGKNLVARAGKILDLVHDIETDLASAKADVAGEVRIAAFGSVATTLIPAIINTLRHDAPQLEVLFEELEPGESLQAAAAKQVDLALVDDSISTEALCSMLYLRPVCEDQFAVVVAAHHRLANKSSIAIAELAHERWALNKTARTYMSQIANACHQADYLPRIVASCRNLTATLEMVRTGYVVTILPRLALTTIETDSQFAIIPVHPPMTRRIFIAMLPGIYRRAAIAAVLRALEHAVAQCHGHVLADSP